MIQSLKILLLGLFLILTACSTTGFPAFQFGQPSYWLSTKSLKEVFVGKTVTAKNLNNQRVSKSYYYADGSVLQKREGVWRTGVWRVKYGKRGGRICLSMEKKKLKCRAVRFNTEIGAYQKYIPKKNGQHQAIILYQQFEDGNTLI